jgi:putative NADPH-quinone reductase
LELMMVDTLVLLFHPCLAKSKANAALIQAAATVPGVEVVDMYALYGHAPLDTEAEVQRLLQARRVVLQFPVQWCAPPALLQTWKDAVLTRMVYIAYAQEGKLLEGTPLMVAATAGNVAAAYGPDGVNLFPLAELLRPLTATAHRCGLPWAEPFLLYEVGKLDAVALQAQAERYAAQLAGWMAHTTATSAR